MEENEQKESIREAGRKLGIWKPEEDSVDSWQAYQNLLKPK